MRLALRLICATLCLAWGASAYYHFVHYASRNAPFRVIPEKFDLNALSNKTLNWFITDSDQIQLAPGDSYTALVSQIRGAVNSWNDVDSADLKVAFGGFTTPGASQSTPTVELVFDETPPGLIAMGGPTIPAASNGQFIPILKSVVRIQPDLRNRPTYGEAFFTTVVHEFGHALGLQHTLTSSVMSTAFTRSTSKAKPLSGDDIAGLSILYPKAGFQQNTGTIAGRVTMNGQGVSLASVVAITPNGSAISALTNPDGTYRIEGLPPRNYFVYVHPLPPAQQGQTSPGDITYPKDQDGRPFAAGQPFETVFYSPTGGVKESQLAFPVPAGAGTPTENINFSVRQRTGYAIHTVETYVFPTSAFSVRPPYLSPGMQYPFVLATGSNMFSSTGPVSGLRATVLGGADLFVRPYSQAPSSYIQLDFDPRTLVVPSNSPRHVVFSANNDIYVLPSAFFHVDRQPPQILSVNGQAGSAIILGTNLREDTRILFDGVPAQIRSFEDLGNNNARITAVPPTAPPGYRSVVTAYNSDGQSSLFLQADGSTAYLYSADGSSQTAALVTPASVQPNAEMMLQIDGLNTNFVDGQVTVGFGSSDISVRRVWVVSPTRLLVNVYAGAFAQPSALNLTIASGLQMIVQPFAAQMQGPSPRPFWLSSTVFNALTGTSSVTPGSMATIQAGASPIPLTPVNAVVVINDTTRVPLLSASGNQMTFQLPASLQPGVATLRVEANGERSLPIAIQVDVPTPRSSANPPGTPDF